MLVRRTLRLALIAAVASVVLTVLWNVGLGVWDGGMGSQDPTAGDVVFSYHLWGRWANLAVLLVFALLLMVAPYLPGARRAAHVLVAGAGITLVGILINVSKAADLTDLVLANEVPNDLVAGRVLEFSTEAAPSYVLAAGVVLFGVGLLLLALDSKDSRWARVSGLLGVAFGVMGLTDIGLFGTEGIAWIVALIVLTMVAYWTFIALQITDVSSEPQTHRVFS